MLEWKIKVFVKRKIIEILWSKAFVDLGWSAFCGLECFGFCGSEWLSTLLILAQTHNPFVLYSPVVRMAWCHIAPPCILITKCVSTSAFVPAFYHHHWDPFRTGVMLISHQKQNFAIEFHLSSRSKLVQLRVMQHHHIGFRAKQQKEVIVVVVNSAPKRV